MKTVFIFFAVLLCLHHISAQPAALHAPTDCCFVFFKGKIPSANIMTVNKIDSNCSKPGFIVTTVKNKRFCLDQTFQVEKATHARVLDSKQEVPEVPTTPVYSGTSQVSKTTAALHAPTDCCFVFFKGKIPSANIMTVDKIDSKCSQPGFIVTTFKNERFCVDQTFQVEMTNNATLLDSKQEVPEVPTMPVYSGTSLVSKTS